jgi:hypothetical protein
MTNTENTNHPTHHIYAVKKFGNNKSVWKAIGAAWPNKDGKGFSIKLNFLPLDPSEIVMREPLQEGDVS